jgi:hypothetical protein
MQEWLNWSRPGKSGCTTKGYRGFVIPLSPLFSGRKKKKAYRGFEPTTQEELTIADVKEARVIPLSPLFVKKKEKFQQNKIVLK